MPIAFGAHGWSTCRPFTDGGSIIDAYVELQRLGRLGPLGLKLLVEMTRQELRRFPVLAAPVASTGDDVVVEWTHDFFAAKASVITAALLAQTVDEASMARFLRRSVRNFLVDAARDSDLGAIRRKIENLLAATAAFQKIPPSTVGAGRWAIAGYSSPPYGGGLEPLVAAAYSVFGVQAVRWSGQRRAPMASDESLIKILVAVLTAAAGAVEIADLTAVMAQRFPVAVNLTDAALDEQTYIHFAAPLHERPDVLVEVSETAAEVYGQLSPSQRALLPHLDASIRDQSEVLGVGRSQTYAIAAQLKAALRELIPDDELRDEVILELYRLCVVNP